MRPLEEVRNQLVSRYRALEPERIPLVDAGRRALATDVVATEYLPSFDNSSMDGFALASADTQELSTDSPRTFRVAGTVAAGATEVPKLERGTALRIFTGAPLPPGADTICPWEEAVEYSESELTLDRPFEPGRWIRRRGEVIAPEELVLKRGTRLNPAAIGLLGSLGVAEVTVGRQLRVAIQSTGSELVDVDEPIRPGQIRNSNLYSLAARLAAWGAIPIHRPVLADTREETKRGLELTLELEPDVILTTGGVSVGGLDWVREVAPELGRDVEVMKVNMKPGKPLAAGTLGRVPFFGLPGNPVACLVSFEMFVRPVLAQLEGRLDGLLAEVKATVSQPTKLTPSPRRQLLRGRVGFGETDRPTVDLLAGQESHQLTTFAQANCLVDIPADLGRIEPEMALRCYLLDGERLL